MSRLSALSCAVNPRRTARHSSLGYVAIFFVMLPWHVVCRPPSAREHPPPRPVHMRDSACRISSEFDIKPVGFLTGWPLSGPDGAIAPYWHWSPLTVSTPGTSSSRRIHSSCHELAYRGCSCRKYLLLCICSWYNSATNSICTHAPAYARRMASLSLVFAKFSCCHDEN